MPKVTYVRKARKDNPVCKKGEPYYWWKFPFSGRRFSLTYPKPQQLTQSGYFISVYDLLDKANDWHVIAGDESDYQNYIDEIASDIAEIGDQCQESLDNMPEALQYAPTGELLQERIDACYEAQNEIECLQEPDQWQEVRDQQEEHDQWRADEPEDDGADNDKWEEAHEDWQADEPDKPEEFEDFDSSDATTAIDNMLI